MAEESKIKTVLDEWGLELVNDLKRNIDKYYSSGGGQASDLSGSVNYKTLRVGTGYTFTLTMNDYWKWANAGRAKGVKGIPLDAVGKEWQNKHGIDARKVVLSFRKDGKVTAKNKKGLNYDKAVKSLAFLIQRSIKKKGIKPRPFYDETVTKERIQDLKTRLIDAVKQDLIININE